MEQTLYEYFNQEAVLNTVNQIPAAITWLNLDHSIFISNRMCLRLSGFLNQENAEGKSYINMPSRVSECYQEFIAQDERAKLGDSPAEFLGLYCYNNNEWKITYGTKSLIKCNEGKAIGISSNIIEINNSYMNHFLTQLMNLESRFKSPEKRQQLSYQLTDHVSLDNFTLTERQSECLFYLLRGFTAPMIAQQLLVSKRTVEAHIESIKQKIGCFTKSELIEKALHEGWISTMPKSILKRSL